MSIFKIFNMICQVSSIIYPIGICYIFSANIFMCAYMDPNYECMVLINSVGEANMEIYMWLISIPIVFYGFILNMKMINDKLWSDN
jgi:hypothetical protein